MKLFKNKKVVLASAIVLGVAAVTSSALAAYIITGGTVEQNKTVNPTDVTVTNKVVNLTVGEQSEELKFMPKTVISGERLTTEAGDEGNLEISFLLTMDATDKEYIPDLKVTVTPEGTAVGDGYVTLPPTDGVINVNHSFFEGTSGAFTYTLTLTWGWGEAFNLKDPCEYYNKDEEGKLVPIKDVGTQMEDFRDAINATTFNVAITEAPEAGA